MANKDQLKDLLKQRTTPTQREAVSPVNLYTNPQVDKTTESNKSIQVDKTTKPQTVKTAKPLVVKYTTHLQPSQIKAIKRLALDTDKKDYEVVGEAIESYLLKGKK